MLVKDRIGQHNYTSQIDLVGQWGAASPPITSRVERKKKKVKDTQAAILRLIVEIEIQAGQKIRGLEYSMCEGSHYKPQYMQVESFM